MNLRDQIKSQLQVRIDEISNLRSGGFISRIGVELQTESPDEVMAFEKSIIQMENLLGLVDILSQRLEEKYKDTPEDEIPMDELNELKACRKIRKAILN